jgi:hypothetical protein
MIKKNENIQETENSLKLKLQDIVVGRNNEIEAIKMQFDSVWEGHSAVTVIAGDIGIGKTALVKTVLSDLSKLNGACVYGKFELYKDKGPYIPIVQIMEQITNYMLTLPEETESDIMYLVHCKHSPFLLVALVRYKDIGYGLCLQWIFCNTMEFPIATFWNFNLQLSVFLSYNKYEAEFQFLVPCTDHRFHNIGSC